MSAVWVDSGTDVISRWGEAELRTYTFSGEDDEGAKIQETAASVAARGGVVEQVVSYVKLNIPSMRGSQN